MGLLVDGHWHNQRYDTGKDGRFQRENAQRIVNNESAEILRMFNSAFDELTDNCLDFYPEPVRAEIDALNARIYTAVNNGVYRVGFATINPTGIVPIGPAQDFTRPHNRARLPGRGIWQRSA